MKNILCFLLLTSALTPVLAFEDLPSKKELVRKTLERRFPDGQDEPAQFVSMDDLVQEWNAIFDRQNLRRDHNERRYDWRKLFPIKASQELRINGSRTFYGLVPKNYRYGIKLDAEKNEIVVGLKLHFYPSKKLNRVTERMHRRNDLYKHVYPLPEERSRQLKQNLKMAEDIWNNQAPEGIRFKFTLVDNAADADYSVKLVTTLAALYDKFIMSPAPADMLAHEIGHMLGLDDEYSLITSNVSPVNTIVDAFKAKEQRRHFEYLAIQDMRCNLDSLMCLRETLYPYHFDHILGRIPTPEL